MGCRGATIEENSTDSADDGRRPEGRYISRMTFTIELECEEDDCWIVEVHEYWALLGHSRRTSGKSLAARPSHRTLGKIQQVETRAFEGEVARDGIDAVQRGDEELALVKPDPPRMRHD
jgi:hypothetical protein